VTDPIKALIAAARRVSVAWRSTAGNPSEMGRAVSALESAIVTAEARPEPAAEPSEFDAIMNIPGPRGAQVKTPRQWIDGSRPPHPDADSLYIHGMFDESQVAAIQADALEAAAMIHENINPDASGGSMGAIIRFRDKIREMAREVRK
jgi:hypothetical protein